MGRSNEITRAERSAVQSRALAPRTRKMVRCLLAIALVLEGQFRAAAARPNGMDRQTLRDRVHRSNDVSPRCTRAPFPGGSAR